MRKQILLLLLLTLASPPSFGQEQSFRALLESARRGNADAQNETGIAYSESKGVKPNQTKAVYWFRQSAERGNVYGACNLAVHYAAGAGVRKDNVQALKWSFIANSLDGLKCNPGDFVEGLKPSECQQEEAWQLAVAWLRAHPKLENINFGGRPWLEEGGEYSVTVREHGARVEVPVKRSGRCKKR